MSTLLGSMSIRMVSHAWKRMLACKSSFEEHTMSLPAPPMIMSVRSRALDISDLVFLRAMRSNTLWNRLSPSCVLKP